MDKEAIEKFLNTIIEMPDISCPTCGREIYCGRVEDMCNIRPCGIIERRKQQAESNDE